MRISVNLFQKLLKSNKMPVTEASSSNIASSPHKKLKLDDTKLMVAKLSEHATLPSRGSPLAAGYDLYSAEVRCSVLDFKEIAVILILQDATIPARGKGLVKTDLQIKVPHGTYGRVAPRSGLAWKHHIDIGAGVVDEDYRGNVGEFVPQ